MQKETDNHWQEAATLKFMPLWYAHLKTLLMKLGIIRQSKLMELGMKPAKDVIRSVTKNTHLQTIFFYELSAIG